MSKCHVPKCLSKLVKSASNPWNSVTFHRFPTNEAVKRRWLKFLGQSLTTDTKNLFVCSKHFQESDFDDPIPLSPHPRKRLKGGAVPSIRTPVDSKRNRKYVGCHLVDCGNDSGDSFLDKSNESIRENVATPSAAAKLITKNDPGVTTIKEENFEMRIKELEEQIRQKDNAILVLQEQNMQERKRVIDLEKLSHDLSDVGEKHVIDKARQMLSSKLTKNQADLLLGLKKRVNWNNEELSRGFTMRSFGLTGYDYLTKDLGMPFPRSSCLRQYASKMDMRQGFLEEVLLMLKTKSKSKSEFDKVCVLLYDEMSICDVYEYDRKHDDVLGRHTKVQVLMIRGLFGEWKVPIYSSFNISMTKDLLIETANKVYDAGYEIVAAVSDCGGGNVGIWSEVDLETKRTYIRHPQTNRKLYLFADSPHLLKLARNHLIDWGFYVDDFIVKYDPLWNLVARGGVEISDTFFLKEEHLTCKRSQRQNVAWAAKVFSRKCATALQRRVGTAEAKRLADFILIVNDWWDVMNSRCPKESQKLKRPYGMCRPEQDEALDKMERLMKTMLQTNKSSMQLFQKGILMSIYSLRGLFDDMKERFGIRYIMTAKLNQDALENLFSMIRTKGGGNDHPSPLQFLRRLRLIILGKSIQSVSAGQSTKDKCSGEEFLVMDILRGYKPAREPEGSAENLAGSSIAPEKSIIQTYDIQEDDDLAENGESDYSFITEEDGFEYVVGAVAKKFRKDYPYVGDFTYKIREQYVRLSNHALLDHDYAYPRSYVDHLSQGGLMQPSSELMDQARGFESFFKNYHKDEISKERGIVARVSGALCAKYPEVPAKIIQHFIRLRTYIRISTLNRKIKEEKAAKLSVKRLQKPVDKPAGPKQKKMRKVLL